MTRRSFLAPPPGVVSGVVNIDLSRSWLFELSSTEFCKNILD